MPQKVLIVEDDPEIRTLVRMTLSTAGIEFSEAPDGQSARRLLTKERFDLVILDLKLPVMSGNELIRHIDTENIPVIVLTARRQIADKIELFEAGAVDYIEKPFDPMELLVRVRSALRRFDRRQHVLQVDHVVIDRNSRIVSVGDSEIDLTPREFDLLIFLAENLGTALTRQRILDIVWGYDSSVTTRTVDIHIGRLRAKIPNLNIKTLHGSGYRLERR